MRLHTSTGTVETSGLTETTNFSIKVNAKAFRILLDGLYADKVAAVIRELSTNAYDAHLAIGRGDQPFTVRLPTIFDPTFVVRDYGVSMDHEATMRLMSTVFASTKDASNTQVGAFGLGSKSPFSLVDTFSLTVWKAGEKRSYSAFFGADGVPAIALLGREASSEPQGVEFSMTIDPKDVAAFKERAERILVWFPTIPEVFQGTEKLDLTSPATLVEGKGWSLLGNVHRSLRPRGEDAPGAMARQGCVVYPLNAASIPNLPQRYADLLRTPLLIDFPIGTLDVAASREVLSYDPTTCTNILARLNSVSDEIQEHYGKAIREAPTLWEAGRKRLEALQSSRLPQALVNLIEGTKWQGTTRTDGFTMAQIGTLLAAEGIKFDAYFWGSNRISNSPVAVYVDGAVSHRAKHGSWNYGDDSLHIYFALAGSRPTYEGRRLREHYQSHYGNKGHILLFVVNDEAHASKIVDAMGNPPEVHWTKDLPEPATKPRTRAPVLRGTTKKEEVKVRAFEKQGDGSYVLGAEKVVPLEGDAYFLITREGQAVNLGEGSSRTPLNEIIETLPSLEIDGHLPSDAPIYCISAVYEARLTKFGGWKPLGPAVEALTVNLAQRMYEEAEKREILRVLETSSWIDLLQRGREFSKLAESLTVGPLAALHRAFKSGAVAAPSPPSPDWKEYRTLRSLGRMHIKTDAVHAAAQKMLTNSAKLNHLRFLLCACDEAYPLINGYNLRDVRSLIRRGSVDHVLQYIEAIDMLQAAKAVVSSTSQPTDPAAALIASTSAALQAA